MNYRGSVPINPTHMVRAQRRARFAGWIVICVVLCTGLIACQHPHPNTVVVYLQGADQQWENMDQQREIEKAFNDMLTLSPDELRNRRYANYQMQPGAWTIIDILHKYFLSRGLADIDERRFYSDVTEPAARAVIREHLQQMRESPAQEPGQDIEDTHDQESETR